MKRQISWAAALTTAVCTVGFTAAAETLVFPDTKGRNLHGDTLQFPAAFGKARFNVAIVAFEQEQQPTVDTWLSRLEAVAGERDDFAYYEFPTIKPLGRMTRWLIYKGMRAGIKDSGARSRTVTFHLEKGPFKRALEIDSEAKIHVFLVDRAGRLIWRESGAWSETKWRELRSRMNEDGTGAD